MINKIRIGHYMPQYGTNTGTGQVLKKLSEIFENHEFIDLVIFKSGERFEIVKNNNITLISFPPNRIKLLPPISFINAVFKNSYGIDVLGIHMPFTPQNFLVHLFCNVPIDYYPHGCFHPKTLNRPDKKFKKKIFFKLFESKIFGKSRKIICATRKEESYIKNLGFNNTAVAHFPFKFPNTYKTNEEDFRQKHNFSKTDFLIAFVGRFDIYTKGLDILVQAMKEANSINSSIKCILIGYNMDKPKELDNLLSEYNCENCVFNLGKMYGEQKYNALSSSNLYVQPSRYESFGVSIVEAMSLRIPCLLSHGCDISSSIYKSDGCFGFDGSVSSLCNSIMAIFNAPDKIKTVADNGYYWVKDNLNPTVLLNKWEDIYKISS